MDTDTREMATRRGINHTTTTTWRSIDDDYNLATIDDDYHLLTTCFTRICDNELYLHETLNGPKAGS